MESDVSTPRSRATNGGSFGEVADPRSTQVSRMVAGLTGGQCGQSSPPRHVNQAPPLTAGSTGGVWLASSLDHSLRRGQQSRTTGRDAGTFSATHFDRRPCTTHRIRHGVSLRLLRLQAMVVSAENCFAVSSRPAVPLVPKHERDLIASPRAAARTAEPGRQTSTTTDLEVHHERHVNPIIA